MSDQTVVFVHGAWHGPWAWSRVQRQLAEVETVAVDLPSAGSDPRMLRTLDDDADLLRETVAAGDGSVMVVPTPTVESLPVVRFRTDYPQSSRL